MSDVKSCNYCGKDIILVSTKEGWRPFDPNTHIIHDCPEGKAARAAKKGGGGSSPKNERLIAKEVCMKISSETWAILHRDQKYTLIDATKEIVEGYKILRDALLEDEKEVS